jgi:hypothetical protein
LPLLILPPIVFFLFGLQWAILSLGVVILYLVVYDVIYVNFLSEEARRRLEIWRHMTFAERDQMLRLWLNARDWWLWGWLLLSFFPVFDAFADAFHIMRGGQVFPRVYYSVAYLVLYAIGSRIVYEPKWRRRFQDFYYSTRYAKEKGWDKNEEKSPFSGPRMDTD